MTVSMSKVFHIFCLVPPADSAVAAAKFEAGHPSAPCSWSQVKPSDPGSRQIALLLKMGGYGSFVLAPLIHALRTFSLVDSAKLRTPHPSHPIPKFYYRPVRRPSFSSTACPSSPSPPTSTTTVKRMAPWKFSNRRR